MMIGRIQYLTWARPDLPIGHVRKVKLDREREQDTAHFDTYKKSYWTVLSIFIVPYESMVVFIDQLVSQKQNNTKDKSEVMKEKREKGYVLSPQERTHSHIHALYNKDMEANQNALLRLYVRFVCWFYYILTFALKTAVPTLVNGIVTVFENGFYYERTVPELFKEFQDESTLSRIYLWHLYEELEHHQESVQLFHDYYGGVLGSLICLTIVPLLHLLLYTVNTFAFLGCLLSFNIIAYPQAFANFFFDLVMDDVMVLWSTFLVVTKASSDQKKIAADLVDYRRRFHKKYNLSLEPSKEFLVL